MPKPLSLGRTSFAAAMVDAELAGSASRFAFTRDTVHGLDSLQNSE